ncbi:MAG: hypothetical protein HQ568_11460, partial [Calditrichaeota bacterium]|nr:hypothetical protein [Calditrichota bacterium]
MNQKENLLKASRILDRLRRSQLRINLTAGCCYAIATVVLIWLLCIAFEAGFRFSPNYRSLLLTCALIFTVLIPAFKLFRIISDPHLKPGRYAEEWWALRLGKNAKQQIRDRLLNAIQVNRPDQKYLKLSSNALSSQALYQVVSDLGNVNIEETLDNSSRRKSLITAAASLSTAILLLLIAPLSDAGIRLLHPRTLYTQPAPYCLSIEPAGGWAYRGEPVTFTITAHGAAPKNVDFIYNFDDGRSLNNEVALVKNTGQVHFDGFPAPITYLVRNEEIRSKEYRLDIVTRPQIAELQYRLYPPTYSRLPMTLGRENVGDVEALPGSRLDINLKSNKRLGKAWLMFNRAGADSTALDSLPLVVTGQTGKCQLNIRREGSYQLQLVDRDGHSNKDPIKYRIRLLTDAHPLVRITFPEEDVILGDNMLVPVVIEADDDYGVGRLELAYRQTGEDSTVYRLSVEIDSQNERIVQAEKIWSLAEMPLFPGDVLEYWAVVWDNDRVNG